MIPHRFILGAIMLGFVTGNAAVSADRRSWDTDEDPFPSRTRMEPAERKRLDILSAPVRGNGTRPAASPASAESGGPAAGVVPAADPVPAANTNSSASATADELMRDLEAELAAVRRLRKEMEVADREIAAHSDRIMELKERLLLVRPDYRAPAGLETALAGTDQSAARPESEARPPISAKNAATAVPAGRSVYEDDGPAAGRTPIRARTADPMNEKSSAVALPLAPVASTGQGSVALPAGRSVFDNAAPVEPAAAKEAESADAVHETPVQPVAPIRPSRRVETAPATAEAAPVTAGTPAAAPVRRPAMPGMPATPRSVFDTETPAAPVASTKTSVPERKPAAAAEKPAVLPKPAAPVVVYEPIPDAKQGRVLSIEAQNVIVLDIGLKHGVKSGDIFTISGVPSAEGVWLADVVREMYSILRPQPGSSAMQQPVLPRATATRVRIKS